MYTLYADGSCQPNPGTGGWAFVIKNSEDPEFEVSGSGGEKDSTNNRMEMTAALKGLGYIIGRQYSKCPLDISSLALTLDSKYVLDGLQTWSKKWIKQI